MHTAAATDHRAENAVPASSMACASGPSSAAAPRAASFRSSRHRRWHMTPTPTQGLTCAPVLVWSRLHSLVSLDCREIRVHGASIPTRSSRPSSARSPCENAPQRHTHVLAATRIRPPTSPRRLTGLPAIHRASITAPRPFGMTSARNAACGSRPSRVTRQRPARVTAL